MPRTSALLLSLLLGSLGSAAHADKNYMLDEPPFPSTRPPTRG